MSDETEAFTANLYINGKKVGYCKDEGHGGCIDYRGDDVKGGAVITETEKYYKSLPKVKIEGYDFMFQPTLENKIGELLEEWLKAKEDKKFTTKMNKSILVGLPSKTRATYGEYKFKVALSSIPLDQLQASVERIKGKLDKGEIILNTNLEKLGITI